MFHFYGLPGDMARPVLRAAAEAGKRIRELDAAADLQTQSKQDGSPLTKADLASHRILVAALGALSPSLPVISEEDIPNYAQRAQWDRLWIIDPLDGTKEFLAGNGEYCVCVALIEHRRPVLGVIYEPASGTAYVGAPGQGAYRSVADGPFEPIHVRAAEKGSPALTLVSRSHGDPELDRWLSTQGDFARLALGSALKFCRIAEGQAQHYARLTHIHEWDVAAGQALVESAGGRMRDISGEPILYNSENLIVPSFLVDIEK